MTTATAERITACPSFDCPAGRFTVENPDRHDARTICIDLTEAAAVAVASSGFHPGKHVHVFDDCGQVVGWARDGVWRGAVA